MNCKEKNHERENAQINKGMYVQTKMLFAHEFGKLRDKPYATN